MYSYIIYTQIKRYYHKPLTFHDLRILPLMLAKYFQLIIFTNYSMSEENKSL